VVLGVTPAMAAGIAERLWEIAVIAKLVEYAKAASTNRGPYKMVAEPQPFPFTRSTIRMKTAA
jgi:hypothetical protein